MNPDKSLQDLIEIMNAAAHAECDTRTPRSAQKAPKAGAEKAAARTLYDESPLRQLLEQIAGTAGFAIIREDDDTEAVRDRKFPYNPFIGTDEIPRSYWVRTESRSSYPLAKLPYHGLVVIHIQDKIGHYIGVHSWESAERGLMRVSEKPLAAGWDHERAAAIGRYYAERLGKLQAAPATP